MFGRVCSNDALSERDRSLATIAALVARNQETGLSGYIAHALDNGVEPAEISETITHLAFYAGWPNVFSAMPVAKDVFEGREAG